MTSFRYQAVQGTGAGVQGVVEAEDRRAAIRLLAEKGLFPSALEPVAGSAKSAPVAANPAAGANAAAPEAGLRFGSGIRRKEITAFSREMSALLDASIPIPQALEGIAAEESNPAMKALVDTISRDVRTGASTALAGAATAMVHPVRSEWVKAW